jgi:hypothetical protein
VPSCYAAPGSSAGSGSLRVALVALTTPGSEGVLVGGGLAGVEHLGASTPALLALPVFVAGAKALASGHRVEGRRSRSHATRPQGAPSTRRPRAGQWKPRKTAAPAPCSCRGARSDQRQLSDGPARAGRGLPKAGGRALSPARGAAQRRRLDLDMGRFGNASR